MGRLFVRAILSLCKSCWGRGQQDASGSEADAGSRNPGSVTEGDGEGGNMSKKTLEILEDKSKIILTQGRKTVL